MQRDCFWISGHIIPYDQNELVAGLAAVLWTDSVHCNPLKGLSNDRQRYKWNTLHPLVTIALALSTGLAIVVDILVDGRPIEFLEYLSCGLVSCHVTCKGDCVCKV